MIHLDEQHFDFKRSPHKGLEEFEKFHLVQLHSEILRNLKSLIIKKKNVEIDNKLVNFLDRNVDKFVSNLSTFVSKKLKFQRPGPKIVVFLG